MDSCVTSIMFATSNKNKFREAKEILEMQNIKIERFFFKHNEIRSDDLQEIAIEAVEEAYCQINCPGKISLEARGSGGFGYDSIFIPAGENLTFAESIKLKNKLSHRYNSLLQLANYIRSK